MKVRIGIVGAGHIGSTLAGHFVAAGHEVILSNSRGPESLEGLVGELGPRATASTPSDAVRSAELVVVSVPLKDYLLVPVDGISDKVVIDTMNYYPQRDGRFEEIESGEVGSSELLASHLGSRRVVKAFNTINWEKLRDGAKEKGAPDRIALAISGDDPSAKAAVAELIDEIGFDAVDVGTLASTGRLQQPGGPLYTSDRTADELRSLSNS